ncbi:MAG: type I-U CRISPR-associated protein Cas5/Cas6 [Nitrososphaerota archaeon]|jgi:CRISPR-associated protein Csb2|nr:type I-U CRISPR-associated protein Cas5/Cas6 [Nitrososphaerota archaeon]
MGFAIIAEFPLGIYRGHVGSDDIDLLPSVARLHAALVCAAASGIRAAPNTTTLLQPSRADYEVLEWLEKNPPTGMMVPRYVLNSHDASAYRELGLVGTRSTRRTNGGREQKLVWRKILKPATFSVAVDGPIAWIWDDPPSPEEIKESLIEMCADVSHLGVAETLIRLKAVEFNDPQDVNINITHRRQDNVDLFTNTRYNSWDFEIPIEKRTDELIDQEVNTIGSEPNNDMWSKDEDEKTVPPQRQYIRTARYELAVNNPPSDVPWSYALLVPLDKRITLEWRVRWAVCIHRALVSLVGDDAPSVLTGIYQSGYDRPANRIAIQFLDKDDHLADRSLEAPTTLAILFPSLADKNISGSDLDVVDKAVRRLRKLRGPGGRLINITDRPQQLDASKFWAPPANGYERRWFTYPAAVPDTRPLNRHWTVEDAVALSVGLVLRNKLVPDADGNKRIALAEAVKNNGLVVKETELLADSNVARYVHKMNPSTVVRPYRALIGLGDLVSLQTLMAIGQSRHLGAGLLKPIDVKRNSGETQ